MNLALFIARRYLFSKKKRNVINIISTIATAGVTFGTMALIVILSVFNGFDNLIKTLFNSFDPDLKITLTEGKTFKADSLIILKVKEMEGIKYFTEVIEENALFQYDDKQFIGSVKGVSDDFVKMSGIDTMIYDGEFILKKGKEQYAVVGYGVAYYLSIGLSYITPLKIWVPKRQESVTFDVEAAFNKKYLYPAGIFTIQQEYDTKYIIVPIEFTRELLEYKTEVTSIEIAIDKNYNIKDIQQNIQQILGNGFTVKDRYQQHELLFKIMQSEKWAIFLILSFIIMILSFNVVGSLSMLIIDKQKDITILQNLGADDKLISNIFLIEGWLISLIGAVTGLILGYIICWIQIKFQIIQFPSSGTFIVNAYPVHIQLIDFIYVLLTVTAIGFFAAWYPVRYISKRKD